MNATLKNVLVEMNFKGRFDALFDKHAHKNMFKDANPADVQKIIEKLGYTCKYHTKGKFFEIDDADQIGLNLSTDIGIVDFILSTIIDGKGEGGPFGYMAILIDPTEQRTKKPRFSSYAELEEILVEGFNIFEDIKKGLQKSRA